MLLFCFGIFDDFVAAATAHNHKIKMTFLRILKFKLCILFSIHQFTSFFFYKYLNYLWLFRLIVGTNLATQCHKQNNRLLYIMYMYRFYYQSNSLRGKKCLCIKINAVANPKISKEKWESTEYFIFYCSIVN